MKYLAYFIIITFILSGISCSKPSNNTNNSNQEVPIVFTTDASATNISLGNIFPVNVTLTSTMPSSQGISIVATVVDQTNGTTLLQNSAINSVNYSNVIQLINLPRQHWCSATIKVSSIATPSNYATKTFNVVFK